MVPHDSPPSVTVPKAAEIVFGDRNKRQLVYHAIREGSLKAWRPWARGDLRINLDELNRWVSGTKSAA